MDMHTVSPAPLRAALDLAGEYVSCCSEFMLGPHRATHASDEDLDLVFRAQAGDADAFGQLVQRHQSIITAMLYRFATNRADLEDMVQETFVRAWRGLAQWRPERPFLHWLKRIASNIGLEFCRKREKTPLDRRIDDGEKALAALTADLSPAQRDLSEAKFILSHLPPDDRALLTLLYLEEMSLAEIAGHFSWSLVNTKVKAFRARQRLKSILTKHGYSF
jgi:RNA polymerase sigma-70 factor, ECF subfamily